MERSEERKRFSFLLSIMAGVTMLVLFFQINGFFDVPELRWYSHHFRHRGPLTGWSAADTLYNSRGTDVVLVEVDAEAWRLIPESWPYSRGEVWANAIDNLSRAGAKVIAVDIQFDSPDARSEYLKTTFQGDPHFDTTFVHGDDKLAAVIDRARTRGTEVILSSKIVVEPSITPPEYIALPVERIMNGTPETGLINDYLDKDGFARRYSVAGFMAHEPDRAYLTLGMKCVKKFSAVADTTIPSYESKKSQWLYDHYTIQALKNSHTFLINYYGPPSKRGIEGEQKWGTFPSFSLASILDTRDYQLNESEEDIDWMEQFLPGTLPAWVETIEDSVQRDLVIESMGFNQPIKSPFDGKIVMIGVSVEVFHDYKSTPFYNYRGEKQFMPGVEVQANAVQTILDSNYIAVIGGEMVEIGSNGIPWYHVITIFLVSAFTVLLASDRRLLKRGTELLFFSLILIYVKYSFFMGDWFWGVKAVIQQVAGAESPLRSLFFMNQLNPSPGKSRVLLLLAPLSAIAASYIATVLHYYIQEQKSKHFLREMFQSYVSPELIEQMYQKHEKPELGGKEGYYTAFFTDIQSFSSFSEVLTPAELSQVMNEYLSAMTDILLNNQGTLDKYIGDAIVAFFGAPMPIKRHEFLACTTAILMTQKSEELREKWCREGELPELVCNLRHRIGINSGEMVTGNMGSSMRMNYTMIGDNVNLAARLESSAKQYGIYIHVSEHTIEKVKGYFEYRFIDAIRVKGKTEPVRTYELLGFNGQLTDQQERCVDIFAAAHEAYEKREWDRAIKLFEEAAKYEERFPYRNTTPSDVYLERCRILKENPPQEDWDGVWTLTSK